MDKKKICWITPDYFADVDIPIVPSLLDEFDIAWIILFPWRNNRYSENDFLKVKEKNPTIDVFFVHSKYYRYDPRIIIIYNDIRNLINKSRPDIIYLNLIPYNPFFLPFFKWLPKNKSIITAHDGSFKSIMGLTTKLMFHKCYTRTKYVHMFSESQAGLFKMNYPGPEIFVIPLALKDFGKSSLCLCDEVVKFIVFGTIHAEKNVQLVIEAANQLFEEGVNNFKVSINGMWKIPEKPEKLIRHPEIFQVKDSLIPNKDIPNLFTSCHYAIYAYKEMSQSGALKIAFNYRKPVIVSDLPGFKDEVENGINGYFFQTENIESLKEILKECILKSKEDYETLVKNMDENINEKYSLDSLAKMYKEMFHNVLLNFSD